MHCAALRMRDAEIMGRRNSAHTGWLRVTFMHCAVTAGAAEARAT